MARGPQLSSERDLKVSATDIVDEVRRHLRTLEIVAEKGEGPTVLAGQAATIEPMDRKALQRDIGKALAELQELSARLSES